MLVICSWERNPGKWGWGSFDRPCPYPALKLAAGASLARVAGCLDKDGDAART